MITLRDILREISSFDSLDEPITIRVRSWPNGRDDSIETKEAKATWAIGCTGYKDMGLIILVDEEDFVKNV